MKNFLKETNIINYSDENIQKLSKKLAKGFTKDIDIARECFLYVRDKIAHAGDIKSDIATCKASEVLRHKTGWCFAKSHLLCALLRANDIPSGFCYQRLDCSEYREGLFSLHGFNAIYLKNNGWYKVDARGNKDGVDAQFNPPFEKLAFELQDNEYELPDIYVEPLDIILKSLETNNSYQKMVDNFPDI